MEKAEFTRRQYIYIYIYINVHTNIFVAFIRMHIICMHIYKIYIYIYILLVVLEVKLLKPSNVIPDGATAAVSIDPCTPDTQDVNDSVTIALPKMPNGSIGDMQKNT